MFNKYLHSIAKSEKGYASFVITLVTMIVVSLIVVAFATDARLEQKDTLASTLATQAYYAAESGINDAITIIQDEISHGVTPQSTTSGQCNSTSSASYVVNGSNYLLGSNGQVQYNCLIVNTSPNSLSYQNLNPGISWVFALSNANASDNISSVTISWYNPDAKGTFTGCPNVSLPSATFPMLNVTSGADLSPSNCGAGVLQLDMVADSSLTANASSPGDTAYLEPVQHSGDAVVAPAVPISQDEVYLVECGSNGGQYACTQTINTQPGLPADHIYYIRLQSYYQQAYLYITAHDAQGNQLNLVDAQILIDSTGVANGQLKRLQERVCTGDYCNSSASAGAIISTKCVDKHFTVYPGENSESATCS
jgi:hypothetical protein